MLIDTWRMCLAKPVNSEPYIALSYVWGAAATLQTTTKNIGELLEYRILADAIDQSKLPQTVVHAIHLVGVFRMRYLWVDSLCIVQDDDIRKHHQIQNMASIYANAWLTIIAAEGQDANHGIHGIRHISKQRSFDQHIFKLSNRHSVCEIPLCDVSQSKWSERGWTFQEYLFSPRRLIFGGSRVKWECRGTTFREDIDIRQYSQAYPGLIRAQVRGTLENFIQLTWPDLGRYNDTVRSYNKRHVTYAKDANYAFAGFCSVLHPKFEGGFLHGLPEMFFDVALLWQPARILEKRISPGATSRPSQDVSLPSWTWMTWRGEIDPWCWQSGSDFVKSTFTGITSDSPVRTIGTVEYYTAFAESSFKQRRKILTTRQKYAYLFNTQDEELPLGWRREPFKFMSLSSYTRDRLLEKREVTTIFKHQSDDRAEFWWPIPISQDTPNERTIQPQTNFLFFHTTGAWFYCARDVFNTRPGSSLRTADGRWVGYMIFHNYETLQSMPEFSVSAFSGSALELVAISQGYAYNAGDVHGLDEFMLDERPKDSKLYEFYNVLWIKWIGEVAYRQGLGRVLKTMWEYECFEADIVLG